MTEQVISEADQRDDIDLEAILHAANEKLDETGRTSANQAFNLGCLIGLIPAALVVLLAFMITQASWLVALITTVLMLIALLGLSNLAAIRARSKSIERVYKTELVPEFELTRQKMHLTPSEFDQLAWQTVPESAILHTMLNRPKIDDAALTAEERLPEND